MEKEEQYFTTFREDMKKEHCVLDSVTFQRAFLYKSISKVDDKGALWDPYSLIFYYRKIIELLVPKIISKRNFFSR